MMDRIRFTLSVVALVLLVVCAVGNAFAGDWGNFAIALVAAIALTL